MTDEIAVQIGSNSGRVQSSDGQCVPEQAVGSERSVTHTPRRFVATASAIPAVCDSITPDMLPLIVLDQQQIDMIVQAVPGGARNVQDIYPLSPLQEGMLFHRLLNEQNDTYILATLFELDSERQIELLVDALQVVMDRHDVLRSAVLWERLPRPVQVVHRHATLTVEKIAVPAGRDPLEHMKELMKPEHQTLELRSAPLMRLQTTADSRGAWFGLLHVHHLACDHQSLRVMIEETMTCLAGHAQSLPKPVPFRNHVAYALANDRTQEAEAFFRGKLADVHDSTAPFDLVDVHGDGRQIEESTEVLDRTLAMRVRAQARSSGISTARLFHVAWAVVVARTSARDDIVFGAVLLSGLQRGAQAQRMLGLSVNTLPLRLQLHDISVNDLLSQTQQELSQLLSYEQVPLTVAQRCSGIGGTAPLFTSLLNFRRSLPQSGVDDGGVTGIRVLARGDARTNYPITLTVDDMGRDFSLTAQTDRRIDPARVTGYLRTALQSLVEALERAPQTPALSLTIVPDAERRHLIETLNATGAPRLADKLIHQLFEAAVERSPGEIALVYESRSLTYSELNAKANQLARHLRGRGVGPDQTVAICVERSIEMVIGLLGILKAGAAYMPLDPHYPADRLEYMLRDAAPNVVLTQQKLQATVPVSSAQIVVIEPTLQALLTANAENLPAAELGSTASSLVYVIYTSGSTGRPKGTAMPHRAVVNLIEWHRANLPIPAGCRVLQFAALSFDVAFQETFSTLCTGGTLVLLDEWVRKDARALTELLRAQSVERLFLPPLMLQSLAESFSTTGTVPATLRDVITAGEQLRISPEIVNLFKSLKHCRLHNHYGPTETHVVTALTLDGDPGSWPALPTIGRPIENTQIYVLDRQGQPVPLGVVGEIFIAGANIARGYLHRPDLAATRFVCDPFAANPCARMYKTGDLGRWRADGTVEYLGRNDDQVKIRGFRIELGEIEAQLAKHEHVKEAAVIAREDAPGEKRLVAYVTPRDQNRPTAEKMRERVKSVLPEHMVPSAFVVLESLPLTPSGKLNRRALPAPDASAYVSREYEGPQGEVEEILAGIWQSLLRVERVGRNDNFFELGGHSLLIVQLKERLRRVGLGAELRRIFESPTLADLASALTQETFKHAEVPANLIPPGCERITPEMLPLIELEQQQIDTIVESVPGGVANVQDIYPLAPLQEGILFHHLLKEEGGDTYLVFTLLRVARRQRLEQLIAAFQSVVDRHDILRSAVLWEGLPRPVQVVHRRATLPVKDMPLDPDREPLEQIKEWIKPERHRMDLRQAPLMQLHVAKDPGSEQWYAVLQLHHMTIDHMALEIITSEAVAHLEGSEQTLPQSAPYRNHVAQSIAYAKAHDAQAFFRSKLSDVDEPTAPFGLLDVYGDGAQVEEAREPMDPELASRARAQARRMGVSAATLFHTAWGLVIAHTSGRDDVVFGSLLLGRLQGAAGAQLVLGMFINTLPVRLRLRGLTVKDLIEHTQRELVDLLGHEQASLAVAQRCSGIAGTAPLFTSLLNYRHNVVDLESEWLHARDVEMLGLQDRTNYPIIVSVDDPGDGFGLTAQTDRRINPRRMLGYMHTAMRSVVEALENAQQTPALSLPILPWGERQQVVKQFNATHAPYPEHKLIHELFEEQVERTPHQVAVVCGDEYLTYRQLNSRANLLAWHLKERGAGPDRFIALCVERGVDMVVGVLGILKSGSAYAPLDPNYPQQRLEYILRDAAPVAVVTQKRLLDRVTTAKEVISLDEHADEIARHAVTNPGRGALDVSSNLAYVIYTSGSTGQPKGVAIEHRNAVNLICWAQSVLDAEAFEETLHSTSLNFDLSVYECFVPLSAGGTLRVVQNALRLPQERGNVTLVNTVPSAIKGVLESGGIPASTRVVNLAGEALTKELVESIFAASSVDQICNLYGPSETTTYSTWVAMPRQEGFNASIGRPIANTQIYILDRERQLAPLGVVGEMYIGGAGVARGYLNQPELTAARFMRDPFSTDPRARMYKTGDVGRWLADGTIQYLGRNDHQVKIRGFRIELGEIEAQLSAHPRIKEAAVVAREDVPGEKRLVAYLVPGGSQTVGEPPTVESLRVHLKAFLPEYMVPSAFVTLEQLPLTQNGKLDRRALPAPELDAFGSKEYQAPQGDIEDILAGIWRSLLRVERVGRHDNFFELGGHSLLIVQMMERLRRVGLSAEVRHIFGSSTLADLAGVLTDEAVHRYEIPPNLIPDDCSAITPEMLPMVELSQQQIDAIMRLVPGGAANIQDVYPLAPLQEGILFHHLLGDEQGDTYVLALALSVSSPARLTDLIAGLQAAIDRHAILRTAIFWNDLPRPVQVVHRKAVLPVVKVALDARREISCQIKEWIEPRRQRLDLQHAPLMRLQIAEDEHTGCCYALLQLHHMTVDHVTLDTITAEVVAQMEGRSQLRSDPIPYRDHVAQLLAYGRTHDAEKFFRGKLQDIDEPTAPFGLLDVHGDGAEVEEAHQEFDPSLAERVRAQARRLNVSAATLFHAGWGLVVAHTSGRDDVVFGTVLLGRLQAGAGAQRMLGMFINSLPLRLQLHGTSVKELVERTQRELVELLTHEQASLATAQRCSSVAGTAPLFTALLNYRHSAPEAHGQWSGASGVQVLATQERTNYPVTMSVDDLGQEFALTSKADPRIDPHRVIGYLNIAMQSLVEALEQAPQSPAIALPILSALEQRELTDVFNAPPTPYPDAELIHRAFEKQVDKTPNELAVISQGQSLTYAELNGKANQLARHLRTRGVGPDSLVAICVERSVEMAIGLLGILKAGGAYVPLDPDYPAERLQYMLRDAAPSLVLTQESHLELLASIATAAIALDRDWGTIAAHGANNLDASSIGLRPENLAYVIYTSGSTGKPKGVMIEHSSVMSLWQGLEAIYRGTACQRIALNASINFDASVKQFVQLLSGRTLMLVPQQVRGDAEAMLSFINENRVEGIDCTPSQLATWITAGMLREGASGIKIVLIGGEPIDANLWRSLAQCAHIDFYNVYGPTESTVDTTLARLRDDKTAPHIGRPMENRRVYLLDRRGQPAPIGVVAEIYIGGAGVARGYLNRPQLTAERFLQDPFSSEPRARIYRTGDLARWRAEGTVEYVGRNDYQVKIRGMRIELQEVEAQLLSHAHVEQAVVIAREDVAGEKRLVAYVVLINAADTTVSQVDLLRAHLRSVLPEYMVPSALVVMQSLPLNASGKLDRRALPAPELGAYASQKYEAPQGVTEQMLAQIWSEVLGVERVGRYDNFFDLGGHSLLVLRSLLRINESSGSKLRVSDVYTGPTVQALAARMLGDENVDPLVDLAKEAALDDEIALASDLPSGETNVILLTGATGFVGRFLLSQLLRDTAATVYCLVRARSEHHALSRLRMALAKWDLWNDEMEHRIVAVPGDLRLPRLGLNDAAYVRICERVDTIYHCATSMNHLETYLMAKPANVGSAREVLKIATQGRLKLVNYISTLSIFSRSAASTTRIVNESSPIDAEKHRRSNGYVASKWVAEKLFMKAGQKGIPCNLFRLGLVWADTQHGRYDELQRVYRMLKSSLLSGFGIENYRSDMAPTPVDYAVRAIVFLARQHREGHGTFHIASSQQMQHGLFERCNQVAGTSLELLPYYDWIGVMKRLHHAGQSLPVVPLIEFAFSMDAPSFVEWERRLRAGKVHFDLSRTHAELERAGILAPVLNDDLLKVCVESMLARDEDLRDVLSTQEGSVFAERTNGLSLDGWRE